MRAALDDAAVIHDQNLMRIDHRLQPVGNDQRGFVLGGFSQLGLNSAFSLVLIRI